MGPNALLSDPIPFRDVGELFTEPDEVFAPLDMGVDGGPTAAALEDLEKNFSILAMMCLP